VPLPRLLMTLLHYNKKAPGRAFPVHIFLGATDGN
jgi:hypothetical protein